jgi:tetratricopeptide (TPR) repeat protein
MGRKNIGLQLDYNKHKKRSMIFLSVFILLVGCGKSTTESITGSFENENEELEEEQTLTWQDQYDLGLRYLSDGNYEEAIIAFKAAIQIDPKRAVGYLYLAEVYCDNGEYDEALRLVDGIPEDIDDMDAISELKKWLESDEKNYPMLMTQDLYDAERGHIWQASYTYDEKGYLIRIDSCEYDENGKNDFIISYIWEYEEFDHAWYFTIEPTGIGEYDQIHDYCGHFRAKGQVHVQTYFRLLKEMKKGLLL